MSRPVEGKPISMYSDEELIELLNRIVCIGNIDPMFCVVAEASARALRYGKTTDEDRGSR